MELGSRGVLDDVVDEEQESDSGTEEKSSSESELETEDDGIFPDESASAHGESAEGVSY
jgi:hypothetical protein